MRKLVVFLVVMSAGRVLAQGRLPQTHVEWFAEPATELDIATGGPGMATIRVNEPDAELIRIVRAEGDIINLPDTPFTVRIYESLWLALEPYAKARARNCDVWLVTFSDKTAALVRRK